MTRHLPRIATVAILAALIAPSRARAADAPARAASPAASPASTAQIQDLAITLHNGLTPDQQKAATLPLDAPERNSEVFTGGKRPGVQIKTLTEDQQKQALALLTAFTSDYGKNKAIEITKQKPDNPSNDLNFGRYYLCYFGDVGPGKTFAWRIAEHHLTLVDVEVDKGSPKTFGPILLGANPPTLWDDEEDKMIALYAAMSPDERAKAEQQGKGISSAAWDGAGVRVGDLSPSAKQAAQAVLDNRLSFFSEPIRQQVQKIIASQGGLDAMRLGFWGAATKRCRDGGRWDFKLAGPSYLCDYENTRGHIHLSMKGQLGDGGGH